MGKALALMYALVAYLIFFVVFLWFVTFVGDIRQVFGFTVPTTVDAARMQAETAPSVIADLLLIALFGAHHSVAARLGFKDALTRTVPKSVERATYVLVASLLLAALMWYWYPIDKAVWTITGGAATVLWVLFFTGWFILFTSTWLLNHFELFGLQQAMHHGTPEGPPPMKMRTPGYYRLVRHPIYLGFFIALWSAPQMTIGHMLLSVALTAYIYIGIHYEERDLVSHYGEDYADYRRKVGPLIPGIGKART